MLNSEESVLYRLFCLIWEKEREKKSCLFIFGEGSDFIGQDVFLFYAEKGHDAPFEM